MHRKYIREMNKGMYYRSRLQSKGNLIPKSHATHAVMNDAHINMGAYRDYTDARCHA